MMQDLQKALREGDWAVTVAIRYGTQIISVWPGFRDRTYGAAVDVGSTTIAVNLCDLTSGEVVASAGAMNPQIRFGEDLMSRVSYAMLNEEGAGQMTRAVRRAVSDLVARRGAPGGDFQPGRAGNHPGGEPGDAPPAAGTGSDPAGQCAICAGHRSRGGNLGI